MQYSVFQSIDRILMSRWLSMQSFSLLNQFQSKPNPNGGPFSPPNFPLCDFGVTPVPIGLGFGFRTALGLGLGLRGPDLGLGLDNYRNFMTLSKLRLINNKTNLHQ